MTRSSDSRFRLMAVLAAVFALFVLTAALPQAVSAQSPRGSFQSDFIPNEILVRTAPGLRAQDSLRLQRTLGARTVRTFQRTSWELWHMDGSVKTSLIVNLLNQDPNVLQWEFNRRWYAIDTVPNDPRFGELWGMDKIEAPAAWDAHVGSGEIIVGVIDSGVDFNHPDLVDNMWTNPGEIAGNGIDDDGNGFIDDIHGWDFANNDNDPSDDNGHGTHVSGTIGAVGDNDLGVVGVNWNVKIMALKFIGADGSGGTDSAIAAIEYAIDNGAHLTSNSWGGSAFCFPPFIPCPTGEPNDALGQAIVASEDAGLLFVAAAGNDSSDNDASKTLPASYNLDSIISVQATTIDDEMASFSNYGATTVDLGAPGQDILSLWLRDAQFQGYRSISGTSMATPHVAGAAALIWSANPGLDWQAIKDRILDNVDPVASLAGTTLTGGRLNVFSALATGDAIAPGEIIDLTVVGGDTDSLELEWTATGDDGLTGSASSYDLRISDAPIDASNFDQADELSGEPIPAPSGTLESVGVDGLAAGTTYHFAIKAIDDAGNKSPVSNSASGTTDDPVGGAPTLSITSPSAGSQIDEGVSVTFTAVASDPDDGDLTQAIDWTSSLDGALGTGGSVSAVLSVGTHTVTAHVVDSDGNAASDSISVEVIPVVVADVIDFRQETWTDYGGQDDPSSGSVTVSSNGRSITLEGNRWIRFENDVAIAANTVLEFDFSSTSEGEIHGVGFDENNTIDSFFFDDARIFQVFGTQDWSNAIEVTDRYTALGTVKHYKIRVGEFYDDSDTFFGLFGTFRLAIVNDDDSGNTDNVSIVSNVQIYDD